MKEKIVRIVLFVLALCMGLLVLTIRITPEEQAPREEYVYYIEKQNDIKEGEEFIKDAILTLQTIQTQKFKAQWHESAVYLAKTLWGEARGCSVEQQEKVVWCILNRVDDPRFADTIIKVVTAPGQFHGYNQNFPCTDELYELSLTVIAKWQLEKRGGKSYRILEPDYVYFSANSSGTENIFRKHW